MKDLSTLLDSIHLPFSRPEYQHSGMLTHCNQFVNEVCQGMGYKNFDGLLANDMIDLLEKDPTWSKIDMNQCQTLANTGSLVLAGLKADPHGHIVVICPGKEKTSGRWGLVPSVANVGKDNFIGKGVNWSFSDPPMFWAWRPSL